MVDPGTTEIIRNAFMAAAEDMNEALFRSAHSPVIYEMKDCSVALFDAQVRLLGQSAGLPIFLGNLEEAVHVTTAHLGGLDAYRPGDVIVLNDAYLTGTHLNDITVLAPIFAGDTLVGFTANRAHWVDVGGKEPGAPHDSTDIFQEGLRLGPVRIMREGAWNQELLDVITRNTRFPRAVLGDLRAQVGACQFGARRFLGLIERYGLDVLNAAAEDIFRQAETLDRQVVEAIPDGTYTAQGWLDNDGVGDEPVQVCLTLRVQGSDLEVDLTGTGPQRLGSTNCGLAQTVAACRVAFKSLLNPDGPINGGSFRNLKVTVPPRTILSAEPPAARSWYFSALGLLIDLFVRALAEVVPDRAVAAHYGDSMVISWAGAGREGAPFFISEATVGGWGAGRGSDGEDALINVVNGNFRNLPVEVLEHKFPLMVEAYGLRPDSEGPGQWRGGFGAYRVYGSWRIPSASICGSSAPPARPGG